MVIFWARSPNGERAQKMRRMDVFCTSCWLGDWLWLVRIAQWCVFWMRPVSCSIPATAPVRLAFPLHAGPPSLPRGSHRAFADRPQHRAARRRTATRWSGSPRTKWIDGEALKW
jgi:hypothetical protein